MVFSDDEKDNWNHIKGTLDPFKFSLLFFSVPRVRCKLLTTFIVPLYGMVFKNRLLLWTFSEICTLPACLLLLINLLCSPSCSGLLTYDLVKLWFIT